MIFGTPEYMAPEQALGQNVDARADLYAVGILIFEMLAGRRPFSADSPVGILGQQLQGPLPTFSKRAPHVRVPVAFEQLVQRLLAPAAASRFQKSEDLALAIDALIAQRKLVSSQAVDRLSSAQLADVSHPLFATGSNPGDAISEEILNASTLPAPEYDVKSTKLSRDTLAKPRGLLVEVASLSRKRVLIWVIGGTLGALLVVVAWWSIRPSNRHVASPAGSASVRTLPEPAPKPLPKTLATEGQLNAARASGVSALLKLTQEFPKDTRAWSELARAELAAGNATESVDTARAAYQAEPKAGEDAKLATVLWKTAQRRESSEKTLELLSGAFGSRGADILYDLTSTPGVRKDIKKAAILALDSVSAQKVASAALKALLALEHAKSCEEKRATLPSVELDADARALPLLTAMRSSVGCGKLKRGDCYACMHTGLQLENAIAAIRKRDAAH